MSGTVKIETSRAPGAPLPLAQESAPCETFNEQSRCRRATCRVMPADRISISRAIVTRSNDVAYQPAIRSDAPNALTFVKRCDLSPQQSCCTCSGFPQTSAAIPSLINFKPRNFLQMDEGSVLRRLGLVLARRITVSTGCGKIISAQQRFDGLHVWDGGAGQARRAGRARLAAKARHSELGLARRACLAGLALRALGMLAGFFSILVTKRIGSWFSLQKEGLML